MMRRRLIPKYVAAKGHNRLYPFTPRRVYALQYLKFTQRLGWHGREINLHLATPQIWPILHHWP